MKIKTITMIAVFALCIGALFVLAPVSSTDAEGIDNDQGSFSAYSYTFNFAFEGTNAQSILWDFGFDNENGDPAVSAEWNPQNITFPAKGSYTVTQTVTNTMGSYVSTLTVLVLGTPEIRFDSVGGTPVAMQTVKLGNLAAEPAVPVREGYTFLGWYTNSSYSELYNFSTAVSQHATLYAKWSLQSQSGDDDGGEDADGKDGDNDDSAFPMLPILFGMVGSLAVLYSMFWAKKGSDGERKDAGRTMRIGIVMAVAACVLYYFGVTDVASLLGMLGGSV